MRDWLIIIWRKIQKSKRLTWFVNFMTWFIETELFNATMDWLERLTAKEKLIDKRAYFKRNQQRIKENMDALADDKSKRVYKNAFLYRGTLKRKYLAETSPAKEKYFDEKIITFCKNELYVEGGAYVGDTVLSLADWWPYFKTDAQKMCGGGQKLDVVCFEPDRYNAERLEKNLKEIKKKRSEFNYNVIHAAMWNEKSELQFESGADYASRLGNTGKEIVKAEKIDDILSELYPEQKVTFIKMDVEGAEPEALEGARATIERDHPTLSICIYHTDEQMISIIEEIRKRYPFYKIYVRHYARAWTETVMYAVPE